MTEGMATGSDAGAPGERVGVPPDDAVAAAVQDDAPLVDPDQTQAPAGDELNPAFREPLR